MSLVKKLSIALVCIFVPGVTYGSLSASQSVTFPLPGSMPSGVAFDGTHTWVTNETGNTVIKLLPSTGAVVGTYPVGPVPSGIAFDGTNIWVANNGNWPAGNGTVSKLLASTGALVGTYSVGKFPAELAFDGANIWVTNGGSNTVTKLSASNGAVLGTFAVGVAPFGIAFDGTNIWVSNQDSDNVTKLRASDGAVLGAYPVGHIPAGVAFDGTNIWVANEYGGSVTTLLASNGQSQGTFTVGKQPIGIAFDGTNIWVTNWASLNVTELRASDGAALGTFTVVGNPAGIAFDRANMWVADQNAQAVSELKAITAPGPISTSVSLQNQATSYCFEVPSGGSSVDQAQCNGTSAQSFTLSNNGTITNSSGQCLDVLYGNASAGVLDFTACNWTPGQQWQQKGGQIIGLAGGCLNASPGTTVDLATCNLTFAQNWQVVNAPTILQSVGTRCLDIRNSNTSPGARLQIHECNRRTNEQIFTFTAAGEIRNAVGECLDVMNGNAAAGRVQMTTCNGTASQKWSRNGRWIQGLNNDNNLFGNCLSTVTSFSSSTPLESALDYTPVGLAPCNGSEAQEWIASGLYQLGPATLLIVTSDSFAPAFTSFIAHKQAIGVPTTLLTMTQVRAAYPNPSSDDALSLKLAIEDYYRNFGTNYVLLGGDNSQVPLRYVQVLDGGRLTYSYRASDLYCANLYNGHVSNTRGFHGNFDNWDSDGDGFYNKVIWGSPLVNSDNVDGFPDIAVGRIPAYSTTVLENILTKIINYENLNPAYSGPGSPSALQWLWAADACYGGAYGDVIGLSQKATFQFNGYAEEIGLDGGTCNAPTSGQWVNDDSKWGSFVNAVQNMQPQWITYVGHGGQDVWGHDGTFGASQLAGMTNQYPAVVFAAACQTSQFANEPDLPLSDPGPGVYDPNASAYSQSNIGSNWLFNPNGGAVAYMGENIVLEDQPAVDFIGYMFPNYYNGYYRLGDMWRMAQQQYFQKNYQNPGYDQNFSPPRIYLGIMALLGDPSMRTNP